MTDEVTVHRDGAVAWITLNRPDRANAFTGAVADRLAELWVELEEDESVRVIVITGAGDRHFCAGADIDSIRAGDFRAEPGAPLLYSPRYAGVAKPVIAAVNGDVVGGGLAFVVDADIVLSSAHANFNDPHVGVGLMCGYAAGRLATIVPVGEALRLALGGPAVTMSAERAFQLGLVQELCPDNEALRRRVSELAHDIASFSRQAVTGSLRFVRGVREGDTETALRAGLEQARGHFDHPDAISGVVKTSQRLSQGRDDPSKP